MIKKLRIKLVCVNVLISACVLAVLFVSLTGYMRKSVKRDQINMLRRIAEEPGHKTRLYGQHGETVYLPCLTLEPGPDGELKVYGDQSFDLSDTQELREIYERVKAEPSPDGVLKDLELRYTRLETPNGVKAVLADTSGERAADRYIVKVALLLGFGTFAIFFAISVALASWAVRPVDLAWRQQKQFVADASHELKTPLTVIISNAELLQQPDYDEAQRRKFTDSILVMARQMRHLVESLLDLARLDSQTGNIRMEMLDLSALTEDSILPFEPVYFERGLVLESEIEPGIKTRGNELALRQCVDILLDNAQKYSEPGAVRLTLRRVGRMGELTVSNPFPELSKAECRDVFKRFYRRDEARTQSGSYGLGLPIASGIVKLHGGKISCAWEAGFVRFTVTLPLITS